MHASSPGAPPSPSSAGLSALPDADLMLLVANGLIEQPVAELFRRHNAALYNYVAWLCQGNTGEAEDVTQKTWVKLMTRCADYQPSAALRTFLFQIARNTWLDQLRGAYERQRDTLDETHLAMPADDLSPEAEAQLRQNLQGVRQALLALPAAQREVIVLRFFSEMSVEDIALTLGEKFETIKSRLRYAFARLRENLVATPSQERLP
ncbi:RNA polymerase sigma factor [Cupriavidus basilensis]|uniref:Sigma-70 family RNA polymerase sigma factor n=1 Tax=Cupriavidus basilensis TaxID=68895 RepID=A0A643G2V4_9BURK|nr:sigma-70 family RNA polymerase sigma factor [Cupriavidus basilensis]QOT77595.1 sigma-70 family RNA polymerase sigma factor [Cupriavidus basilensis]